MGRLTICFPEQPLSLEDLFSIARYVEPNQDACPFISALLYIFGIVTLHLSSEDEAEAVEFFTSRTEGCAQHRSHHMKRVLIPRALVGQVSPVEVPNIEEHGSCGLDGVDFGRVRDLVAKADPPIVQWWNVRPTGNLNEGQRSALSRCVAEADFPLGVLNALLALVLVMHHDCQIVVDGSEIRVVTDRDSFKPTILQKKLGKRPERLSFEDAMARVPESMAEQIKTLKDVEEQSRGKEDDTGVGGWTGFEGARRSPRILKRKITPHNYKGTKAAGPTTRLSTSKKTKNQSPESVVTNEGGSMTGPANTAEESTPAAQLAHLDIISNRSTFLEMATSPVAPDPFPLSVRPNATKNELHAGLCETRDRWQRAEGQKQGVLIGVDQVLVHAKTCQEQLLAHAEAQTGRLLDRFDACMEAERKDRERHDREEREERTKLYALLVGRLEKGAS